MNKYLDQAEADLISQAKHVMADNDKVLTKLEQDCEVLSSKIEKLKQTLDTEMYQDNALFINAMECKTNISCIEKEIDEVQSENMRKYKFVSDKQLQNITSSTKKFGTLDVTISALRHQTMQPTEHKITQKKKEPVRNDNNATGEVNPVTKVLVGSRVQHNSYSGWIGTVTAVHPDGTVDVEWDCGWRKFGPFAVGKGNDVTLI